MATKEEDNFLRIVYLNYRVGTTALRRYFDYVHSNLPSALAMSKNIFANLYNPPKGQRKVLYQEQWDILYPSSGSPIVSSDDLDVTLMVCLLRNMPPTIIPPPKGFDALPQSCDLSPGAHIARIKYYKNFLVSHSNDGKLSDTKFNTIWIDLEMAIHGLGNQQDVQDAADAKHKVLDYKALMELVNFGDSIQRNLKKLTDHSNELSEHTTRMTKLETTVENMEKEVQTVKKDIAIRSSKGVFKELKGKLISSSILDKDVLDNLISKCVLTVDDREEIYNVADQASRNKKVLEILMNRPYNTFNMFVEALKDTQQDEFVASIKAQVSDKDLTLQNLLITDDIEATGEYTVKLIKWYKNIVDEVDTENSGILNKLVDREVISSDDYEELSLENMNPQEKSRGLIDKIVRRNMTSACMIFLEVLKEDSCCKELASKIERTVVTQLDLELLRIGIGMRERKKRKQVRKRRKKNGMTDLMIDKIEKWEKDDSLYITTRATVHVLTCINKHKCVSVTGPSGIGKTALVRHVALQMETNGYTILPMTDGKEIKDHYKSHRKTLYIVDDMCGNFTANQRRLEEWKKSKDDIKSILDNSRYKIIVTCRLQVFQDKEFDNLEIFKTCECNLRSRNLSLTSDEKENITIKYFKENAVAALKHLGEYEFLPLLCKLYDVEKTNQQFSLSMFLNDPFSFYTKDLTHMYNDCREGKYKYCALLLLVIFNNHLDEKHLTCKEPKVKTCIEDIIEVCDIDEPLTGRKLKNQLEILTGTFVTNDEGIYKTIHDKLFDFLAFYFGTQEEIIDFLIKHAKDRFIRERCFVSGGNESIQYSIPISDNKLQMYTKRVFDDIVCSSTVNTDLAENINLKNVKFRTKLLDFMEQLSKHDIITLIERANSSFLNTMFVMKKNDVKDIVGDRFQEFECFGITLTDELLQQYIGKWFNGLIETDSTKEFLKDNRLFTSATFCSALKLFMTQLSIESINLFINTGSANFLKTMFVKEEQDIKGCAKQRNECFGIIISDDVLQQYIERMFDDFTKSRSLERNMEENRPLMNGLFRTAFRAYINHLTLENIATLIQTADDDFINKMFVMTEEDIKENSTNRYKCFGIVIPDDLLQQYIQRLFEDLIKDRRLIDIYENRPLMNATFQTAFRTYIKQLSTEKIGSLITNVDYEFLSKMFVMTEEDIKQNAQDGWECFGIVIPDDLLQQYCERFFDDLTKLQSHDFIMDENRLLMNDKFCTSFRTHINQIDTEKIASLIQTAEADFINQMFVLTQEDIRENTKNRYECFGIVIPVDLIRQYCKRLFDDLNKSDCLEEIMNENRPLMNFTFRTVFRTFLKQLDSKAIASLIQTSEEDIFSRMFVMAEEDIKEIAQPRYECFGIVIPDDLLHHYCNRLLEFLTEYFHSKSTIHGKRPLMNVSFRTFFRTHIRQLTTDKIVFIIQTAGEEFINKMFVISEEDLTDNAKNQYEMFCIVIPDVLFEQYIHRFFDILTKDGDVEYNIAENKPLLNANFRRNVRTYMRQLKTEKIASLIQTVDRDFINKMFVMTEEDIDKNADNRYECFGIVIPDDLLQQYCQRLIEDMTKTTYYIKENMNENRPLTNVTFRTAFSSFIRQLHSENIAILIQTAENDFFNRMFVIAEDDIKENATNLYQCFGIVIPNELLQHYMERLFDTLTNDYNETRYTNRPLMNVTFYTAFRTYIRQLHYEKMYSLIQTADEDFINNMFFMTEDDIHESDKNRDKCFGIVITDDLLQHYIERVFDNFTRFRSEKETINENRPLMNVTFRSAFRTYISQLTTEKIASLIQTADDDIINILFVMTEEDIKENAKNRYECFGIVIPDDLLQQYIQRLFDDLTKTTWFEIDMKKNRPLVNNTFRTAFLTYISQLTTLRIASLIKTVMHNFINKMFVMTEEDINENAKNLFECFGIVIPDDLLHHYIQRLFYDLTKIDGLKQFIDLFDENRPLRNISFRTAFRTYIRQMTTEKIDSLIQLTDKNFINKMFVMTQEDIEEYADNRYEWFGIVIPVDLLDQYIQRWIDDLIKTSDLEEFIDKNRLLKNVKFCNALCNYTRKLNTNKIAFFIWNAKDDFLNIMFIMSEEDIKVESRNRYECFGIVIPDDLLQIYIGRWLECLTRTDELEKFIYNNRPLMNASFRTALRTYMKQLNTEKDKSSIQIRSRDILNVIVLMNDDEFEDKKNYKTCLKTLSVLNAFLDLPLS